MIRDFVFALVIAALASGLTYAVERTRRQVANRRLRRRYPLAGVFATSYDDPDVDGKVSRQKARAELRQNGTAIRGFVQNLDDERRWEMEGTLSPERGFLTGVYRARDPHDLGQGFFFLGLSGHRNDLDGFWAGYDPALRTVIGGRWVFRRSLAAEIRTASAPDIPYIISLLGDALGELYVDPEEVRNLVSGETNGGGCVVAAAEHEILAAATIATFDPPERLAEVLPVGQEGVLHRLPLRFHSRIGLLKSIAVAPHAQGRGLGMDVVRAALDRLVAAGATYAVSFGWKSPEGGCHIQGVLDGFGFEALEEVENFWTRDSREKGYDCPACRGECQCSAVIFGRRIGVQSP